jgi:hypothetical protein
MQAVALRSAGLRHTATLTLRGRTTCPESFRYPRAVVTLSASADLRPPEHDEPRPAIGSVHASNNTIDFYAFVPAEHMAQLVQRFRGSNHFTGSSTVPPGNLQLVERRGKLAFKKLLRHWLEPRGGRLSDH